MKFLLMGDTHLRITSPVARKEKDFSSVCLNKFKSAVKLAVDEEAELVQVGDLFDSSRPSYYIVGELYKILTKYNKKLYTIFGNHDQLYHSSKNNKSSAQKMLTDCGCLHILNEDPVVLGDYELYGQSWGEEIPVPNDNDKKKMLVAHQMVGIDKIFDTQKLLHPTEFIKEHKGFDIYAVGHYHLQFIYGDSPIVINPGCLLRLRNIEVERKRKPEVVLYDEGEIEIVELPHDPEPFVEKINKVKNDSKINELINELKLNNKTGINFNDSLDIIYSRNKTSQKVKKIISTYMGEVNETTK